MAECTHLELRKAREAKKLTRWQLGGLIGVSESTIERWESGESKPTPEDVDHIGDAAGEPGLWHRWMLSNHDSYRRRYIGAEDLALPVSVMRLRHAMADATCLQDAIERDAIDGTLDDDALRSSYAERLKGVVASATDLLQRIGMAKPD